MSHGNCNLPSTKFIITFELFILSLCSNHCTLINLYQIELTHLKSKVVQLLYILCPIYMTFFYNFIPPFYIHLLNLVVNLVRKKFLSQSKLLLMILIFYFAEKNNTLGPNDSLLQHKPVSSLEYLINRASSSTYRTRATTFCRQGAPPSNIYIYFFLFFSYILHDIQKV